MGIFVQHSTRISQKFGSISWIFGYFSISYSTMKPTTVTIVCFRPWWNYFNVCINASSKSLLVAHGRGRVQGGRILSYPFTGCWRTAQRERNRCCGTLQSWSNNRAWTGKASTQVRHFQPRQLVQQICTVMGWTMGKPWKPEECGETENFIQEKILWEN